MSEVNKILYKGKEFYIQREGTQIAAITHNTATEYSRLDVKTKRAVHWYARKICDRIYYHFPDKEEAFDILCLGSAMGAIPYELLSYYPKCHITCVDIDWESIYVMEKSILKEFVGRVTYFEGDARLFLQQCSPESFDIILNDLFTEQDSPPFIHSNAFLRSIFHCLKHEGLYFANTITDVFEFTHGIAIEKIGYEVERFTKKKEGMSNIIYEVLKD